MLGGHLLKSWSSTQPSISLSSGEAEYYGVVKAAGIALGQQSLMHDLGMKVAVRVWTDSSAAMGICGRSGLGKLRHVQTHTLWVQERVKSGAIELRKVNGLVNPADLFTKHLVSRDRVDQLVQLFNCEYRDGRSSAAPELRKKQQGAETQLIQQSSGQVTVLSREGIVDPNNDSTMHDPNVLPHNYDERDLNEIFFRAEVPEDQENSPASRCMCGRPDCQECFPPHPSEFSPPVTGAEAWLLQKYPRRLRTSAHL